MEMPEDDQPDDSIWNHPERLEAWFEQVKERRMNPGKSASVEWEDVDMTENELTKEYRKA